MAKPKGLFMFGDVYGSKGTASRVGSRNHGVITTVKCETIGSETRLSYNEVEDCYEIKVTVFKPSCQANGFHQSADIKTFTYKTNEE